MTDNRKPHLLRIKREIVELIDLTIGDKKRYLASVPPTPDLQRDLAIWIRQRNKIARDAGLPEIPLERKDGSGKIIYVTE